VANWLADPVACAVRLKDNAKDGCIILAGREEVMSRSTRVYRAVEGEGTRNEETVWRAGNIEVRRLGKDHRQVVNGKGNLQLTRWKNESQGMTIAELLSTEAIMMADVLRAAAVNAGGSACGGETILELLWRELMVVYERLMTDQDAEDDRGIAQGLAYAIAIMQNPYRPNIDTVREQAAERWEQDA
jgi:hypothetical protein